jgi:small subunit ribosomal protein S4
MANYTGPKSRLFRRFGIRLATNGDIKQTHATIKKAYPPGMHGNKGTFGKKSEYARQLMEKQKAKVIFNISEKQMQKYFDMATKIEGITSDEMLRLMERRLDNVIFRSGLATTRYQARQMVNHGLIEVNGKVVSIPSVLVEIGDKFNLVSKKKDSAIFKSNSEKNVKAPKWLNIDLKNMSGEVSRLPDKGELEPLVAGHLIVEFYSK